jgi:hypothetical protein
MPCLAEFRPHLFGKLQALDQILHRCCFQRYAGPLVALNLPAQKSHRGRHRAGAAAAAGVLPAGCGRSISACSPQGHLGPGGSGLHLGEQADLDAQFGLVPLPASHIEGTLENGDLFPGQHEIPVSGFRRRPAAPR